MSWTNICTSSHTSRSEAVLPVPKSPRDDSPRVEIALETPLGTMPTHGIAFVPVRATNTGGAPFGVDGVTAFSYRWLIADRSGSIEGARQPLQAPVAPGESVVTELVVVAPPRAMDAILLVTLLSEGKKWFDEFDERNAARLSVTVAGLSESERESPAAFATAFSRRFPRPQRPWGDEYDDVRTAVIETALDAPAALAAFERAAPVAPSYGIGLDERVVEYPWFFAQRPEGRLLDAGSTLNHAPLVERLLPQVETVHVHTLAPESRAFWERGISYGYGDIRELPFRDEWFDTIACLSTLEHVGKDNSRYGARGATTVDAAGARDAAVRELWRTLRQNGRLLVTVPFGRFRDDGWQEILDRRNVERIANAVPAAEVRVDAWLYTGEGWRPARLDECDDAVARVQRSGAPDADLAAGARAVACISLTR
jgi:SAM-dependent methyltransferase